MMAYLFFILWIFFRSFERILNPQILSEDGRTFLNQAFSNQAASLLDPYAGYFHTLPRLLALLATQAPVEWMPQVLGLPCLLLFALLLGRICQEDYSDFLCSKKDRILAACLFSLTPGLYEVLGNPTNIHWILSLHLAFLGLRNLSSPLKLFDIFIVILAVSSGGECLALLPLFAYRYYLSELKSKELFVLLSISLFAILNFLTRQSGPGLHFSFFLKIPSALTYLWNNWILLQPLTGDHLTHYLGEKLDSLYWLLSVSLTTLIAWRTFKNKKTFYTATNILFGLFCLSLIGMLVMIWVARQDAFGIFNQITRDAGYSLTRYSFLIGVASLAFHLKIWPHLFSQLSQSRWTLCLLLFSALTGYHRFLIPAHEPKTPRWSDKLNSIRFEQCQDKHIKVEIWPADWFVQLPVERLHKYCSKHQ